MCVSRTGSQWSPKLHFWPTSSLFSEEFPGAESWIGVRYDFLASSPPLYVLLVGIVPKFGSGLGRSGGKIERAVR